MTTSTYTVTGLTCGHCVQAVTEEVSEIDGVTAAHVDLVPSGESTLTVSSETPVDRDALAAAITEAGEAYQLI